MGGIVTRWVIGQEHDVTNLDADGYMSDNAVRAWVEEAVQAYLECCLILQRQAKESGLRISRSSGRHVDAASLGRRPSGVLVTASASEVRPDAFTISVRLRPGGSDSETPVNTSCVISLVEPATGAPRELGPRVRDELIALEHAATHFN